MIITQTVDETRDALDEVRRAGKRIGFVPTMGFLHEGHLSLIDVARKAGAEFIVVSIFVNPKQFGVGEDFERYPRDEKSDREQLEKRDVDVLFMPAVDVMYPEGASTMVVMGSIADPLEGDRRPGHFTGVATVVTKLFNIVHPDIAVFGQKDAQQCAVVRQLVRDLDVPVELVFGETVREHDGLAMSSRNSYLTPSERALAPALHRALRAGEEAIRHGVDQVEGLEQLMTRMASETYGVKVDYFAVVDPMTFARPSSFAHDVLLVGAIKIGTTRLIDNILVSRKEIPHTKVHR